MPTNHQHFQLDTAQCVALALAAGDRVQVTDGCIWLTLEGHSRDVWLTKNGCWTVPLGAKAWISAEGSARFTLIRPLPPLGVARPLPAGRNGPVVTAA